MTNTYGTGSTQTQKDAVAKLMADVGIAWKMGYGPEGSGASTMYGTTVYPTYFKYKSSIHRVARSNYDSANDWMQVFKGEVQTGRPSQMKIRSSAGGHSVVVDGYRDSPSVQVHINMGWYGSYDGWYVSDNFTTGSYTWDNVNYQEAIVGIEPISAEKTCWCCIDGHVSQMTPAACKEKQGRCYGTEEEAKKACRPQDDCKREYPAPKIKFDHRDAEGRVYIPVINWADYSNEMFRAAPELPPCGLNTNSSRTWVDIYDANTNKRVYGFCAFGSNADLKKIWFMSKAKSGRVYIVLKDRACKKNYRSNTISWP